MNRVDRIVAALLACFVLAPLPTLVLFGRGEAGAATIQQLTVATVQQGHQVRVHGCEAEDTCRIDYRRDPEGRGVWVIRQVTP